MSGLVGAPLAQVTVLSLTRSQGSFADHNMR
jgi:hypothetical protein